MRASVDVTRPGEPESGALPSHHHAPAADRRDRPRPDGRRWLRRRPRGRSRPGAGGYAAAGRAAPRRRGPGAGRLVLVLRERVRRRRRTRATPSTPAARTRWRSRSRSTAGRSTRRSANHGTAASARSTGSWSRPATRPSWSPPPDPPATWDVDLTGRGPGGDVVTTFRWTTPTAGGAPAEATGSAAVLADHDGSLDSYGVEVFLDDLAEQPRRATATVTVVSASGDDATIALDAAARLLRAGRAGLLGPAGGRPRGDQDRRRALHLRGAPRPRRRDLRRSGRLARRRVSGHGAARAAHLVAGAPGVRRLSLRR